MPRKVKYLGGVGERGLGMELRYYREKAGMSCAKVGAVLGWSANTISRLERGLRPETTAEEVSAILAAIGVTGAERDRIMRMAKGYREQGWWEGNKTHLTDQAHTYLKFDPMKLEGRVARRLGRQAGITKPDAPELLFLVSELALRQPVGGPTVMARQVRKMIEEAGRPNVSIRVLSAQIAAHPGMLGGFVLVEFADEPAVVFIEGRRSGMFPENPDEIADYRLAAERLMDLTADERQSVRLLHAIAEDLEKVR